MTDPEAMDDWEAQCLKRGNKKSDAVLPTRRVSAAMEDDCAALAAAEGITTTEYRRRLALQRIAELRAQLAKKP